MEIALKDRTVEVDATPLQAAVLEMFDVRREWEYNFFSVMFEKAETASNI